MKITFFLVPVFQRLHDCFPFSAQDIRLLNIACMVTQNAILRSGLHAKEHSILEIIDGVEKAWTSQVFRKHYGIFCSLVKLEKDNGGK